MRYALAVALFAGLATLSAAAAAQRGDQASAGSSDKSSKGSVATTTADEAPSRWRGSILLLDQSATTQTFGVGSDYQSSNPTYELWLAFKPRYTLFQNESKTTTIALNLWSNVYLELTNSDTTTTRNEPILGPTFFWASWSQTVFQREGGYKTTVSIGPRVTFPTDKESRNSGRYGALGATGGVTQTIPLAGKDAPAFNTMRLGISGIYGHPLNRYTTPTNDDLNQTRQDVAGRLLVDNQLRFGMNVRDTVSVSLSGGVQLMPKLDLGIAYVIGNSWTYRPPAVTNMMLPSGEITPQTINDPTNHRVSTWALASLDYEALDEMSVGIGYYNLTNQIGPDGQRRNPLWSPDARFFLTVTGNLDVIAKRFTSNAPPPPQTASASPAASTK